MADLSGVVWSQGIAFGSPVVPDENRIVLYAAGSRATVVSSVSSERNSSHRLVREELLPRDIPLAQRRR
jgi:hypothetical protein